MIPLAAPHPKTTPSAWMMIFWISYPDFAPVLNPVPGMGHFRHALLGHSWQAPKARMMNNGFLPGSIDWLSAA
jgi:hypothetical protein